MQTKPKQKLTAILIAFTMILTTMMQLCIPITAHADDSRTLEFHTNTTMTNKTDSTVTLYDWFYKVVGTGYFTVKSFTYEDPKSGDFGGVSYVCSNKSFNYSQKIDGNYSSYYPCQTKGNLFYTPLNLSGNNSKYVDYTFNGLINNTHFNSYTDYTNACENFLSSFEVTKDDYEEKPSWIELDKNGTYSEDIPTPKIKVSSNLDYTFENGQSDYFYEVKGRWRSIDNITVNNYNQILSKGQIYYKTILKGDLLWWITANDKKSILETGNLTDIGHDSFYDFITKHPIDSRTIVASGNGFYNPFDETIPIDSVKTSLKIQNSAMNSFEIYIRYYKIDDSGNYIYGKWSHYYNNLIDNGFTGKFIRDYWDGIEDTHYQSQNGLTKEELENVENLDDSLNDSDITTITNPNDSLDSDLDFSKLTKVLMSLYNQAKTIFSMYGTVFNFLPEWVINIISVSFVIVCFVGIWKVIR